MQTAEIAEAIRIAQNVLRGTRRDPWPPHFHIGPLLKRASWPPINDPGVASLVELLRLQPELMIFDNMMQFIGRGGRSVSFDELAGWLIRRAEDTNPESAITDLANYVLADAFAATEVLAIGNIQVPGEMTFCGDLALLPVSQLRQSVETEMLLSGRSRLDRPTAALSAPVQIPRTHGDLSNLELHELHGSRLEELVDASHVLTLAGDAAPIVVGAWVTVGPEVPLGDRGTGVMTGGSWGRSHRVSSATKQLTTREIEDAGRLYGAFRNLSDRLEARLRIALERLNRAKDRASVVDASIELGIALEALFLNDQQPDRGELTFRLRIRAARLLDGDLETRRQTSQLVRLLYEVRSSAVHTGAVEERKRGPFLTTAALLNEGYALVARAIVATIERATEVDWSSVELG